MGVEVVCGKKVVFKEYSDSLNFAGKLLDGLPRVKLPSRNDISHAFVTKGISHISNPSTPKALRRKHQKSKIRWRVCLICVSYHYAMLFNQTQTTSEISKEDSQCLSSS